MINDFLWTGLGALVMVSPFIIGAIAQHWNDNRTHNTTRKKRGN
jgi:hypothetical protein